MASQNGYQGLLIKFTPCQEEDIGISGFAVLAIF